MSTSILVTGGAGYIGSHICIELLHRGYTPVIVDNFSNSYLNVIDRMRRMSCTEVPVIHADVLDLDQLNTVLRQHPCEAVIHLAGLKSIEESHAMPTEYYEVNAMGTLNVVKAMRSHGITKLILSSSATVYGTPQVTPIPEEHPTLPVCPYGRTKLMAEHLLTDLHHAHPELAIAILRYFNPVGAHPSGLLPEQPRGIAMNLMPNVLRAATQHQKALTVYSGYDTPDGTGVRDYIHVMDLAEAHVTTLNHLNEPQCLTLNIGTGRGYSVLDVVREMESITQATIPLEFAPRRTGDLDVVVADPTRVQQLLRWTATHDLTAMCKTAHHAFTHAY